MSRLQVNAGQTFNGNESLLADVLEEITLAMEQGVPVDFDDYRRRYSHLATELEQLIPAMDVLGKFGLSAVGAAAEKTNDDALAGQRELGDYRILREIGRGGMGVVYEAEQLSLHRKVALKVLPFAAVMDERHLSRFKNEAQIAAQLIHQNIVPVYAVGCERGVHYYAMQYIEGQSLADVIRQLHSSADEVDNPITDGNGSKDLAAGPKPQMPASPSVAPTTVPIAKLSTHQSARSSAHIRGVAHLGSQAAEALEHAHRNGVIHRDIKPANLLLDVKGNLWVTDFGLARIEAAPGLTLTGDVLGTLRYISPEQALAKRVVVDHRTDIYSLGVTLYELLTLRPAYDGRDRQELMRQIAFDEPCGPRRLNETIPVELETIVLKAMEKNPADRYETAGDVADDLARFLDDKPILAKRASLARRLRKWSRRHRPLVASAIFMLLVGLVISTLVMARERDQALSQQREMSKQLRIATALRLAAQSQSIQNELPIQSLLLAVEATEVTRRHDEGVLPLAQESLREALSAVGGQPLLGKDAPVILRISSDSKRMATSSQGEVRLWDLTKPWKSEVVLRGQNPQAHIRAVSSDGRWILTVEPDATELNLWDLSAADPLRVLRGHTDRLYGGVEFSPNGRWLVTGSRDGTTRLWDLSSKDPSRAAKVIHTGQFHAMAISPDSRWIATGSVFSNPRGARLWDLTAEDPNSNPIVLPVREHEAALRSFAFSADSRWLATGSGVYGTNPDTAVKVWDLHSDDLTTPSLELPGDSIEIEVVKFSPDGRWLVSAGLDSTAQLWDLTSSEPAKSSFLLPGHSDSIWDATISRDSHWLVTASYDRTARVWNLAAKDPSAASMLLRGHESNLGRAHFTPDSQWVITSSSPQYESRVWRISNATAALEPTYDGYGNTLSLEMAPEVLWGPESLRWIRLTSDGSKLTAAGSTGHARIWNLSSANPAGSAIAFSSSRSDSGIKFRSSLSRDGRWLVIVSAGSTLDVWDLHADPPTSSTRVVPTREGSVPIVGLSPDDRWLLTTDRVEQRYRSIVSFSSKGRWLATDRTVTLWALSNGGLARSPIVLRADNQETEGSADHAVRLWNLHAPNPAATSVILSGHKAEIRMIKFSPDDRWMATASQDRTVRLWAMQTDGPKARPIVLHGHEHSVELVVFGPDGRWLVTSSEGENVQLWNLSQNGFWKKPFPLYGEYLIPWNHHPFSADGRWLATLSQDNAVRLWSLTSPEPTAASIILRGHAASPRWVRFSPDSRWLASVGGATRLSDKTLRLWDLSTDDPGASSVVLRGPSTWIPEVATFTPDSQRLIAGSRDGQVRIWHLDIEKLHQLARRTAGRELTQEERTRFMLPQ